MRAYILTSGIIFGVVALIHAVRLIQDWPVQIGGHSIPMWASWPAIVVAGALFAWALRLALRPAQGGG